MILKLILSYTEVEFFTIVQKIVCLLFILIYQTIKSSKIEYTVDYYQPSMSDLSSMLLRISKVLLLKQNQQIANRIKCNEVDDKIVIQCVFTV
jgi:hypothetical protein